MDTKKILIVEDEALQRMALEEVLVDAGFPVVAARSGDEAIRLFQADPEAFSAIVTDIRLGQGSTGWDVGRAARELIPTMPIVYVSGDSAHEWAAQGVPESIMIQKPYAFPQITTAIATLMNALKPPMRSPET